MISTKNLNQNQTNVSHANVVKVNVLKNIANVTQRRENV